MFGGPIEHRERLCTLVDDERIVAICNGVLGEHFNYASGDGNYYSGDTGWHPDGNWGQLFSVKIAFYLDDLTRDTGCLRIIPGSHHPNHFVRAEGIDLNNSVELFGIEPRDFPGNLALETTPGDLVIFKPRPLPRLLWRRSAAAHVHHEPHPPLHQRGRPSHPQGIISAGTLPAATKSSPAAACSIPPCSIPPVRSAWFTCANALKSTTNSSQNWRGIDDQPARADIFSAPVAQLAEQLTS